jgi:hypothetical protein
MLRAVEKGAGSRGAGLAIAFRLLLVERSWRRIDAHELLPLVRAGVGFKDGVRVERDDNQVRALTKVRLLVNKETRGTISPRVVVVSE